MEQKKLLLSIMVVGMLSSAALAIAPTGPPGEKMLLKKHVKNMEALSFLLTKEFDSVSFAGVQCVFPNDKLIQEKTELGLRIFLLLQIKEFIKESTVQSQSRERYYQKEEVRYSI